MVTTVEISRDVLAAIVAEAAASADEICGLLFGTSARITLALPCANVAADRATAFEIDPAALLLAHRRMRAGGPRLIGCYHSHPSGPPTPSARDAQSAAADGWLWLIAARSGVGLWRAVAAGARHGRFDPVELRSG